MNGTELDHVWFATKRRKWLLDGDLEDRMKQLLHEIAEEHQIDLVAAETMIDHVHLLIRLGSQQNLSRCMNLLKGASARRIFLEMPDIKLDAKTDHFWQKRFDSKLVAPGAFATVKRYIETQKDSPEKYVR